MPKKLTAPRKIDSTGRVLIPAEIQRQLNITSKTTVNVTVFNGGIFLELSEQTCAFCGSTDNILIVNDIPVCSECYNYHPENKETKKEDNNGQNRPAHTG